MPAKKSADLLQIAVTFPRSGDDLGPTRFTAGLTSEVVSSFIPDADQVRRALRALQQRGFTVTAQGRLTASVRGSRRDFETLFGTHLTPVSLASTQANRYSASSVLFPAQGAPWNPDPEIARLIDDAYIQWPHIYMNQRFAVPPPSPLPPNVAYHHLRVPGDVTLLLNASRVHRAGTTGKGVRVAMIDSGFAHGHPYFVEHGYNSSVVLAPSATQKTRDGSGHGTGESANLLAVAPDVTFIGIKLDNEENPDQGATLLEGFQEALQHNPQVISVSIGYDLVAAGRQRKHLTALPNSLRALEAEIAAAVANGIVVVFSAGNGHVSFPAMMPDVIAAGGVYVSEIGAMQASDYASAFSSRIYPGRKVPDFCGLVGMASNHADYIMLPIPPDCEIDSDNAAHDGTAPNDGWGVFSGTSAAAPQLAGLCALLLQKNPGLSPQDIKNVLRRTARDVVNGAASRGSNAGTALRASRGIDGATGAGLVDAFAAWMQV